MPQPRAVPLGLIVSELVSNALKHAFTPPAARHLRLALASAGHELVLTVADDGRGLAADLDVAASSSLGRLLVFGP